MLEIKNLSKSFHENKVLDHINLKIEKGDVVGIISPSGTGKSTLLRCINQLEIPEEGEAVFGGKTVDLSKKHKDSLEFRKITGMVFQRFYLFEKKTALENVREGLMVVQKKSKADAKAIALKELERVGMASWENHYPKHLSGGQQQRVAIARALVNNPKVLLLDEPLGALDLKLRKDMQKELKAIQKRLGITFIYVTHDQEEALSMSDTVVVMDKGKIQQIGTPEDIYNEPVNAFVADFIGESNIVDAVMVRDYVVRFGGVTFDCLDSGFAPNEFVEAVVRPEDIRLCDPGHKAALTGTITDVVFKGVFFEIFVDVGGFIWMVQTTHYHAAGNTVGMYIEPDAIHIMKRSEYSGEFGDYSTFSDEMDHISDADYNWEEESDEQSGS